MPPSNRTTTVPLLDLNEAPGARLLNSMDNEDQDQLEEPSETHPPGSYPPALRPTQGQAAEALGPQIGIEVAQRWDTAVDIGQVVGKPGSYEPQGWVSSQSISGLQA